jgi:hypothetical protein
MTQEDIIRMAKEAGIHHAFDSEGHWDGLTDQKLFDPHPHPNDVVYGDKRTVEILERFAAFAVKEAERKASFDKAELWIKRISEAVLAERKRIADIIRSDKYGIGNMCSQWTSDDVADDILKGQAS